MACLVPSLVHHEACVPDVPFASVHLISFNLTAGDVSVIQTFHTPLGSALASQFDEPLYRAYDRTLFMPHAIPYKLAVLVFIHNPAGEHLLLLRAKAPNLGSWSPIGGKLETGIGESPYECAVRETREETGLELTTEDLHLFGIIAEKAYEGQSHWLLFLFQAKRPIEALPPNISEGKFGFFTRAQIDHLAIPETDRSALWPIYDQYKDRFVALRADCHPQNPLTIVVEEVIPESGLQHREPHSPSPHLC